MSDIHYKIEFHSYWHCSSGQAAGSDVDELVIKYPNGLPFVPGKTLKGLFRDACDELVQYHFVDGDFIRRVFGDENSKSECFFSDAVLPQDEETYILQENLGTFLYDAVSATSIDEDGIAKDHSLRKTQVALPCTLYGVIEAVPKEYEMNLIKAMGLIKRLGRGRSRGFGRCTITKR